MLFLHIHATFTPIQGKYFSMKYTIRGYALAHRMTLHQVFCKAYRERYGHTPNFQGIREDIDRYENYGAVPPYISDFLSTAKMPVRSYIPYWVPA